MFVIQNKENLTEYLKEQYGILKIFEKRVHEENSGRERDPSQRDFSRVLYSSSFRRLQGKMQLLGIESSKFFRNRLTHSLEVAQIARGIVGDLTLETEKNNSGIGLNQNIISNMYVAETCSLAHDLGNPPFGHFGEELLNEISQCFGGFNGNAQTFRILTKIEKKLPEKKGLNLTTRSLLGVVKYFRPWCCNLKKKFLYKEDFDFLYSLINCSSVLPIRTVDAQIMDLADEIAYAAHDLEDSLSLRIFDIDEFVYELKNKCENEECISLFRCLVKKAKKTADKSKNYNSFDEYSYILRKEIISNLVHKLIKDIGLHPVSDAFKKETGTKQEIELQFTKYKELVKAIKTLTFDCINRIDVVQRYEKQGAKIIKGLYEVYSDKEFNKDGLLLPIEYRPKPEEEKDRKRLIVDYIAGMMDEFAVEEYTKYFGANSLENIRG